MAATAGAAYATIPAANLLPSPHRVVSIHDSKATSWNGAGNPADYMNQTEINNMVQRGVMELTGQTTPLAAWQMLIPYQTGDAVAIKMNFNNVPNCNFTENANMNAYAAVANAVIQGLESIGVPPGKIWITDPSRPINDAFRAGISDANVAYYTKCTAAEIGSRPNVFTTGYISETSPDATLFNPAYGLTDPYRYVLPAQVFEDAAHIINIPQLKGHGDPPPDVGGVTLGVKNHFGSVSLTSNAEGDSPLHSNTYFFQMMGDINANPVFYNKTRLVIGDGIMGNPTSNWQNPVLWSTFGNEPPDLFFFGVDPIAVDSVMFDYIQRECAATSQPARDDKVESYAASLGLGVLEHWDNGTDRQYQIIDYHEIDFDKGPQANLSASSLSWGSQIVGTSSSPQTLRLWNNGNPPLAISGMNTSGDFAETDNCENSVPAGTNCTINVTFLPTAAGSRTGALTISDNAAGSPQTVSFSGSGVISQLSLALVPSTVKGGGSVTGTVTLSAAAPAGGAVVTLASNNLAAQVASSVTVAAGATTATFPVTTSTVATTVVATISATYNSSTQSATLTVIPVSSVTVTSVALIPTSVVGGNSSTGTVTLSAAAPAGGAAVTLASNNLAAQVASSVTVAAGATTATFTATTSTVATTVVATISAAYNSSTQSAPLTVYPVTGPPTVAFVRDAGKSGESVRYTVSISPTAGDFLAVFVWQTEGATTPSAVSVGPIYHQRRIGQWPRRPRGFQRKAQLITARKRGP